jgi:hypothetical protein
VGLHLVSSDYDVHYMSSVHVENNVVELYIVSFQDDGDGDGEGWEDDKDEDVRGRVACNDPWWDDKISGDEDVFEVNYDVNRAGPSTYECVEGDRENGDGEGNGKGNGNGNEDGYGDGDGFEGAGVEGRSGSSTSLGRSGPSTSQGRSGSSTSDHDMQSFENVEVVDNDSEMGRSDILMSQPISDDDSGEISSNLGSEFHAMDLVNPSLKLKMKFSSLQLFREAVKQYNVQRGKDIQFVKNERARCVALCTDPSCDYKVYGRQMSDEQSFEVRSLRPKHSCTCVYKSSIVNSRWISDKLFDKFKIQPDMPLEVIQDEVKRRWNVEVTRSQMYRGRRRAGKQIFGSLGEQYGMLWDYCETLRQTNKGSRVMMKVERPTPDSEPMFQRLYKSLAAMKQRFLEGCRPVIGLDGCFLKGPYKGTLLAAVGRDANNNMYPIAIAIVEAEIKES